MNTENQGKRPDQISYSEKAIYWCIVAAIIFIPARWLFNMYWDLPLQRKSDVVVSFATYFGLFGGAFLLWWITFDKRVKVGTDIKRITFFTLVIYLCAIGYHFIGFWWTLYLFLVTLCFMFFTDQGR